MFNIQAAHIPLVRIHVMVKEKEITSTLMHPGCFDDFVDVLKSFCDKDAQVVSNPDNNIVDVYI